MTLVSMTPLGMGESVSKYVAKVVDVIDESGLAYTVTPMGTIIESDTWDEVMSVLKNGFEKMQQECSRISIAIKIDYRTGKAGRIKAKIESLERRLGKDLNKID